MTAPKLSAVVPVYNERENVEALHGEIKGVLDREFPDHEIIFVDDGSTDGSVEVVSKLCEGDPRTKLVAFRRNFGQTAAISAGFHHASGEIVVALDADRQNDPADIPKLVRELGDHDVASGWRADRKDGFTRTLPSRVANGLISCVIGLKLHDYGCTLKAYRREVLEGVRLYGEQHRFIPALLWQRGARVKEVPVNHRPRTAGRGKYGLGRTTRVLYDLMSIRFLAAYGTRPMHFFGGLALFCVFLAIAAAAGFVSLGLFLSWHTALHYFPLVIAPVPLLLFALNFFAMGLIAEYVARAYQSTRKDEVYAVRFKRNL